MTGTSSILFLLVISFVFHARAEIARTSFSLTSFPSDPPEIAFQGAASSAGGSLELNEDGGYSYGRAIYSQPVHLWDKSTRSVASFSTRFSFSVIRRPNQTYYGDGLAFFLSPVGYALRNDTTGGELTLFRSYLSGARTKAPVVAVEFDTFMNEWDPELPHIGIDAGFIESVKTLTWDPFLGETSFTATAEITYDAGDRRLRANFSSESGYVRILADVIDLREELPEKVSVGLAGGTGLYFQRHSIHSWSFESSLEIAVTGGQTGNGGGGDAPAADPPSEKKGSGSVAAVAGGVAGAAALAVAAVVAWFVVRRRRAGAGNAGGDGEGIDERELDEGKGPKCFSYAELARATKNFSPEQKLGRGGFGDVYRGTLSGSGEAVAIKRVARDSRQGKKEYLAEIKVISRVRHRNLVRLVGWCHEKGELLLAYELMPNGSLDTHLFGGGGGDLLPWATRFGIAKGVASALLYLHEEWEQCVIHRDVKSSNVMLDSGFGAKLGDFGLARLVEHGGGMETTAVAGTMGYLAPETATTGRASKESDVYSFGVLALEIACGRRPLVGNKEGTFSLVEWVWELYGRGEVVEAADERLKGDFDRRQMERLMVVGLWCAHPDYLQRPTMGQVMGILAFDTQLPELPPQLPAPSYGGVSISGMNLASMQGWSSTASGASAGLSTGSSVDSARTTASKPLLKPSGR